jgi:Adenylate and Guanylate cyclase catalytic domain
MATGGFLGLHAPGTAGVLFTKEYAGFMVAIPVGLLVSALFAGASAVVDVRPGLAALLIRHRSLLRAAVLGSMIVWFVWTVVEIPPLSGSGSEAARSTLVAAIAVTGTVIPLITRRYGGEVEKFIGDGVVALFNRRGDQPDHATRAARAALALQERLAAFAAEHPEWPRMRVGVNSGQAVVREIGGHGHVAYPMVGDTVNTRARLESLAPAGGVLIGPETYDRLPDCAIVEERPGLRMKGKDGVLDAYVLLALPC